MNYKQIIDLQQIKRLETLWRTNIFNEKILFTQTKTNINLDENSLFLLKVLQNIELNNATIAYLGSVKDENGNALFNEHFINFLQRVKTRMP